jgi:hypothetical protein
VSEWALLQPQWEWKLQYPLPKETPPCEDNDDKDDSKCTSADPSLLACLELAGSPTCDNSEKGLVLREKAFWSTRVFGYTVVEDNYRSQCDEREKLLLALWLLGLFLVSQLAYLVNAMMPHDMSEDYSPAVKRMRGDVKDRLLELTTARRREDDDDDDDDG